MTLIADPRVLARWRAGAWATLPGQYRLTLVTDAQHPVATAVMSPASVAFRPH